MIKLKTPRIRIPRPRKRIVIISIASLVIIALGIYGFISYTVWRDLDQESKQVASSLKTAVDKALGVEKETMSPLSEMKTLVSDFDAQYNAQCQTSPLFGWQTIIPQVKTINDECTRRFSHSLEFITSIKPLITFIENEQTASALLSSVIEATRGPTDYTAASAAWKTVADSIELNDAGAFQSVADKTKEVASDISTAYTSLASAVKNEDKTAFDDAVTALDTAYATIVDISTLAASKRQALIDTLANAYDQL